MKDEMTTYSELVHCTIRNEGGFDNVYYADGLQTRAGITWKWNVEWFKSIGIMRPEDIGKEGIDTDILDYYTKCLDTFKIYMFHTGQNMQLAYQFYDHAINDGYPDAVRLLQRWLNSYRDKELLVIDGGFGPLTTRALGLVLSMYSVDRLALSFAGFRRSRYYTKYLNKLLTGDKVHAVNCLISWNNRVSAGGLENV